MILKKAAQDIANAFTKWNLWEGGGGSSALAELSDVEITTPQVDDVLKFDGSKWINAIIQGGGSLGGKIEFITQITVLPLPVDFTKYDLYIYVVKNQDNYTMGSVDITKYDFPTNYIFIPCNDSRRVILLNGNQIYENSDNNKVYLYGLKLEPIEPNLHEYSTDEKVVGKWIDNKPIYEKVVNINDTIPNIDILIECKAYAYNSSSGSKMIYNFAEPNWYASVYIDVNNTVKYSGSGGTPTPSYIIVQYTKTTD